MIKVIPKAVGRKAAFKSLVLFWPFNPKLNIKTIYRKLCTVHFQFHEKNCICFRFQILFQTGCLFKKVSRSIMDDLPPLFLVKNLGFNSTQEEFCHCQHMWGFFQFHEKKIQLTLKWKFGKVFCYMVGLLSMLVMTSHSSFLVTKEKIRKSRLVLENNWCDKRTSV